MRIKVKPAYCFGCSKQYNIIVIHTTYACVWMNFGTQSVVSQYCVFLILYSTTIEPYIFCHFSVQLGSGHSAYTHMLYNYTVQYTHTFAHIALMYACKRTYSLLNKKDILIWIQSHSRTYVKSAFERTHRVSLYGENFIENIHIKISNNKKHT